MMPSVATVDRRSTSRAMVASLRAARNAALEYSRDTAAGACTPAKSDSSVRIAACWRAGSDEGAAVPATSSAASPRASNHTPASRRNDCVPASAPRRVSVSLVGSSASQRLARNPALPDSASRSWRRAAASPAALIRVAASALST